MRLYSDDPVLLFWKWLKPLTVGDFSTFHEILQSKEKEYEQLFVEQAIYNEWDDEDGKIIIGM